MRTIAFKFIGVCSLICRRSWVYVVNVLHIKNSIQLCKLLINFNQIVCSHQYSTKEIKWSPSLHHRSSRILLFAATHISIQWFQSTAIGYWIDTRNQIVYLVYEYFDWMRIQQRFETIKMHALFSLNGCEYAANCLICVTTEEDARERRRSSFCGMLRIFSSKYAFVVCNANDTRAMIEKISHSTHFFQSHLEQIVAIPHFETNGNCVRIDFISAIIKCNWNSSNSIRFRIVRNAERESGIAKRKESCIYHNVVHILRHWIFRRCFWIHVGFHLSNSENQLSDWQLTFQRQSWAQHMSLND